MKSRYLLGPATSPPDLRNGYCGRGYYSPSLRAVVYEPEANRPRAGIPSLGSEQIHPARYCASAVRVRDPARGASACAARGCPVGRPSSRSGATVSRFMRARSWSCLCLESPELLLVFSSSACCTAEELIFPRSNSFSKHKLLLWKGIVSQCYYPQ